MSSAVEEPTVTSTKKSIPTCIMCKVPLCDTCGLCEQDGCRLEGRAATTKADLINLKYLLAETQKARGLVAIAQGLNVPSPYRVISDFDDIESAIAAFSKGTDIFVRPCPVRPRHGFVESRPVKGDTPEQLIKAITKVFKEARTADEGAELLMMPTIKASHNLVLTPSRMSIGTGHDGATAGHNCLTIPLAGVMFKEITPDILKQSALNIDKDDPYIEAVLTEGARYSNDTYNSTFKTGVYLTQLRAGERIPAQIGDDFIPEKIKVSEVIEASGDLLEWEAQTKKIGRGTVVYHLGGSLISHYGVHCIQNKVPILTTRKPKVGETLTPTKRPDAPSIEAVQRGLIYGAMLPMAARTTHIKAGNEVMAGNAITMMIVALHNSSVMSGEDGFYLGAAVSIMLRSGFAAAHGEVRHKTNPGSLSREQIYHTAFKDFFGARSTAGMAHWVFDNWGGSGGGFGGPKWASCIKAALGLEKAVRTMLNEGTQESVAALITNLNNAVNQAHNNGWWLNKFVPATAFDMACKQSLYTLCTAAPVLLALRAQNIPDWSKQIDMWRGLEDPIYKDPAKAKVKLAEEKVEVPKPKAKVDKGESIGTKIAKADHDAKEEECDCPMCTAVPKGKDAKPGVAPTYKKSSKLSGSEGGSVVEAQAKANKTGTNMHVQMKLDNSSGYISFDVAGLPKLPLESFKYDKLSWAGSESPYFGLTVSHVEGSVWKFSYKDKTSFNYDVVKMQKVA